MFGELTYRLGEQRMRELREDAARRRRSKPTRSLDDQITLRFAAPEDAGRLRQLAELDSADAPAGAALVAEVDGLLRAALPLDGAPLIADPFHCTADVAELLRLRAAQLDWAGSAARP